MLGAVVAAVGNALAPRINGDDVVVYHKIAASTRFAAAGVIVLAAVVIVTAAFVGLTRIRSIGGDTELASYGRLAAVAGGAIAVLQTGVELYAYRQQAKAFDGANAHNVVSAFWATNALDHTSSALFATWTLVLLGAAPVLIGVAQLRSRTTGRLGVAAIVGGAVCCVVGVASLLTADQSTYDVPFGVGSAIVTIWLFVTGLVIWLRGEDREINIAEQSTRQTQARVAAG
jgi:hypothetical protein